MPMLKCTLYHYWRSSSSWRVRMALAHKGIVPEYIAVDLLKGEQTLPLHIARNPAGQVPCLEWLDAQGMPVRLAESVAITEWLEECYPNPPLLPRDPLARARVREIVQLINAGIQPVQNMKVMQLVSADQDKRAEWAQHWIGAGFSTLEKRLALTSGRFCVGDDLSLADIFLVPQCYNAVRFAVPLNKYAVIERLHQTISALDLCQSTAPEKHVTVSK